MTVREAATDLLSYLSPGQRSIPCDAESDDPLPEVVTTLRGALEEMGTLGPMWQFRAPKGALIHAPLNVTVAITAGATTFNIGTGLAWTAGCSFQIQGETWNEILDYNNGTGAATVKNPFTTTNASITATIYCDSITLPDDVLKVIAPVTIADSHTLTAMSNYAQWQGVAYYVWRDQDYGMGGVGLASSFIANAQRITSDIYGPRFYFVDSVFLAGFAKASRRMRLAPMPAAQHILHYRARVTPGGTWTTDDIYAVETPDVDPDTVIPLDDDTVRSVFLPIARQRFTACPFFRNDNALPEIKRQYDAAYKIAKERKPQSQSGFWIQPGV